VPTTSNDKKQRVRRWERHQKQEAQERRIRGLLRERKQARKASRGPALILRHLPGKNVSARHRDAAAALWDAARHSKLVEPGRTVRAGWPQPDDGFLVALARLSAHHAAWVRDPGDWAVRTHNPERQFAALARHLLCRYDVPRCFDACWFNPDPRAAKREQSWYLRLGRGQSLRSARGLPLQLTRRAAHLLPGAPGDLTVFAALRWAQLRAIGADAALIDALLASPMGTHFARDDFWLTAAQFFIAHPLLAREQVGPVADYLHHQRFVDRPAELIDGRLVNPGPAQPNLSLRGRASDTLLRQVRRWHAQLGRGPRHDVPRRWRSCGIAGLDRIEGTGANAIYWQVRELCDARELLAEGRTMHHCVGTYAEPCARGACAIFALTKTRGATNTPELTVEVRVSTRQIVQARGKHNALPTQEQMRVMSVWATEARLLAARGV